MIWPKRRVDRHLRALTDGDWRRRRLAASALGRLGDRRAVVPLGQALTDRRAEVRAAAARVLRTNAARPARPSVAARPGVPRRA